VTRAKLSWYFSELNDIKQVKKLRLCLD